MVSKNDKSSGPTVSQARNAKPFNTKDTSANKGTRAKFDYAKGGSDRERKMFGEQKADASTGSTGNHPSTGKPDVKGPGKRFAAGGPTSIGYTPSQPAAPGRTSPIRSRHAEKSPPSYGDTFPSLMKKKQGD